MTATPVAQMADVLPGASTAANHRAGISWLECVAGALLLAMCVFAGLDAWRDLAYTGLHDEESSHVLLAPLAFVWIFLYRRPLLSEVRWAERRWAGPAVVVLAWGLWWYGYRYQVHTLWHLGAIIAVVGGVISLLGLDFFVRFAPAFGALLFLIPMAGERRQQLSLPLQLLTARITQPLCETFGMMVDRHGNQLTINGVDIAIVEACNGMRMFLTLFIVSYLYMFTTPLRGYVRVLLLLATPVLAVGCNVLRLVPTVWMFGHVDRPRAELFHQRAGWVMLVVAFFVLMGIVQLFRWLTLPVDILKTPKSGVVAPC